MELNIKLEGEEYRLLKAGGIWIITGDYAAGDQGVANAIGQAVALRYRV